MNVAAIVGPSNSGKTTLIAELIRRCVGEGKRAGAIKHTHHALNEHDRGDTAAFRAAGADPVILAGDREAVIFRGHTTTRVAYERPRELLAHFETDIVFIEGFRNVDTWPRFSVDELAANPDRIWRST